MRKARAMNRTHPSMKPEFHRRYLLPESSLLGFRTSSLPFRTPPPPRQRWEQRQATATTEKTQRCVHPLLPVSISPRFSSSFVCLLVNFSVKGGVQKARTQTHISTRAGRKCKRSAKTYSTRKPRSSTRSSQVTAHTALHLQTSMWERRATSASATARG
jgi:hypothetical protein